MVVVWGCCAIVVLVAVTAGVLFPTALYCKDDATICFVSKIQWPLWYAVAQAVVLTLTLAQVTLLHSSPAASPGSCSFEGNTTLSSPAAAGATCSSEGNPGLLGSIRFVQGLQDPSSLAAAAAIVAVVFLAGHGVDVLAARGAKWLHRAHVVRNLFLYLLTLALDAAVSHATSCANQQPWLSGVPIGEQVGVLVDKWHDFHRPEFFLVRVSHAFTYLDILLLLSQRTGRQFAKWRVFVLFVPDIVADIAHYASSPSVATERLAFDGAETGLCAGMDQRLVRTLVSYPMNWIFLTSPLGHPAAPSS